MPQPDEADSGKSILSYFDGSAQTYEALALSTDVSQNFIVESARRHIQRGDRILDVACGTGLASAPLVQNGAEVFGIDGSQHMLDEFAKKGVAHDLRLVNLQKTMQFPYEDGFFNGIVCNGFLYFVADLGSFVAEAARVLKPGGFLTFNIEEEHGENGIAFCIVRGRQVSKKILEKMGTLVYFHNRAEVNLLLVTNGFGEIAIKGPVFVHKSPSTGRDVSFTFFTAKKVSFHK